MYRLSIACVVLCSVRIGCRVLIVFCLCGPVLGASWLLFSVFCLCGPVLSVSRLSCTDCLLPVWSCVKCE